MNATFEKQYTASRVTPSGRLTASFGASRFFFCHEWGQVVNVSRLTCHWCCPVYNKGRRCSLQERGRAT